MKIVRPFNKVPAKEAFSRSIYIAILSVMTESDVDALDAGLGSLKARGFTGIVFVPSSEGDMRFRYYERLAYWELDQLELAARVIFWLPTKTANVRDALRTQFGIYAASGKAVLCGPEKASGFDYLRLVANRYHVPSVFTLDAAFTEVLRRLD